MAKTKERDGIEWMSPGETLVTPELKRWMVWMHVEHGHGVKSLAGKTGVSMEWIDIILGALQSDRKFWEPKVSKDGTLEFDPENPPVRKGVAQ